MAVVIYTVSQCQECQNEKSYLTNKGLLYEEVALDRQPEKLDIFTKIIPGFSGVPLAVFAMPDGTMQMVKGFNQSQLDAFLAAQTQSSNPLPSQEEPQLNTIPQPAAPAQEAFAQPQPANTFTASVGAPV